MISGAGVKRRYSQAFEEEKEEQIAELKRQLKAKDLELEEWEKLMKMKKNKLEESERKNLTLEQQCKSKDEAIKLLKREKEEQNSLHNTTMTMIMTRLMKAKDLELEEFEKALKMKKEENNSLRAEVKQLKLRDNRGVSAQGWASSGL